ncbi:TPA: hypothetical protein N0F65_006299 [Lagenidium giganteum]|uniref:Chromosome segregation in meiosis protein 3 domain-containing protein n=1 Tax=Lagenidium giganteum TaxID=4803 RepID=A0AAV2YPV5_9STRA|nr:TPA: hypothetical protein N0F65_006299 [Lagenidium giganteum]
MMQRRWEADEQAEHSTTATAGASAGTDQPLQQDGTTGIGATTIDKPVRRKRRILSEHELLSSEGLKKIYRTFPYQVSANVAGQEAKALNNLMRMYKQWAYDLYPGLNFDDFIDRTEFLGKTHGVQGLLTDLRAKETRRANRRGGAHSDDEGDDTTSHNDNVTTNIPDSQPGSLTATAPTNLTANASAADTTTETAPAHLGVSEEPEDLPDPEEEYDELFAML